MKEDDPSIVAGSTAGGDIEADIERGAREAPGTGARLAGGV
jgi:hypothetical protein